MRLAPCLVAAALLLAASPAHPQAGYGGDRDDTPREHVPTHADSTRTLAGPWQVWAHAGFGWLGAPPDVRSRYNAGLDAGASGDRRLADRVALRARLEYHDLPSTQPNIVYVNGYPVATNSDFGHGWLGSGLAGVAVRTWNRVWLEGGGGGGYFRSGFPSDQTYVDGATGQVRLLPGGSGWGAMWNAGVRYEFQPTLRDRMLAELQFYSLNRGGVEMHFWALRVGYRAF